MMLDLLKIVSVVLFFAVGLGAMAVAVVYVVNFIAKRREAMRALAKELCMWFDPFDDDNHKEEFGEFAEFIRDDSSAFNTIHGQREFAGLQCYVKMGDFKYTTGSDDDKSTNLFSYAIIQLPFEGLPTLSIRKEGIFDKAAGALGFDDIDFESSEFSRTFLVKSSDKRFAYDVIHPKMMEFLMQGEPIALEFAQCNMCFLNRRSTMWKPEEYRRVLQWAESFLELWPEHVTTELAVRARVDV